MQVLYSYLFGIVFFHEHLTLFGALGTALIALGMACVTARTPPQQPVDRSDAARDAAGAGMGSRMFHGLKTQDSGSSSFVARCQSFQRLLGLGRSASMGGPLGQAMSVGKGVAGEEDSESLLIVEEHVSWREQRLSSSAGGFSGISQGGHSVAPHGDLELVPAGSVQHRHWHVHEQEQLLLQPWQTADPSAAEAILGSSKAAAGSPTYAISAASAAGMRQLRRHQQDGNKPAGRAGAGHSRHGESEAGMVDVLSGQQLMQPLWSASSVAGQG